MNWISLKTIKLFLLPLIVGATAVPIQINENQFLDVAEKIVVKTNRITPAMAAYEDIYDSVEISEPEDVTDPTSFFELKTTSKIKVAFQRKIQNKIDEYKNYYAVSDASSYENLSGISISAKTGIVKTYFVPPLEKQKNNFPIAGTDTQDIEPIKKIKTQTGLPILVTANKGSSVSGLSRQKSSTDTSRSKVDTYGKNKINNGISAASVGLASAGKSDAVNVKAETIAGHFKLSEGLPFNNKDMYFEVFWVDFNEILERGKVFVDEARFEVEVESHRGRIEVELWNKDGVLIGLGNYDLTNNSNQSNDIEIKLTPYKDYYDFKYVASSSDYPSSNPIKPHFVELKNTGEQIKLSENNHVSLPSILAGSDTVVLAKNKNFWDTLSLLSSNKSNTEIAYANTTIEALVDLTLGRRYLETVKDFGIILGKVTENGKPVSGATVELSSSEANVFYFSGFIPDKKRVETSENGMFAILMVNPGLEAIRVKRDGNVFVEQFVVASKGAVTQMDLEASSHFKMGMRVVDASTGNPIEAIVKSLGKKQTTRLFNGEGYITTNGGLSKSEIDIDAGTDYPIYRMRHLQRQFYQNAFILNYMKIAELKLKAGAARYKTNLLGIAKDHNYEVKVHGLVSEAKIIYFDEDLNITSTGVAGGGFLIVGAENEISTVEIEYETGQIYQEIAWLGEAYTNLIVSK